MKTQTTKNNKQNSINKTERNNIMCNNQIKTNIISKRTTISLFLLLFSLTFWSAPQQVFTQVNPTWQMQYDNGGQWDKAHYIAVHQNGTVFVTGESPSQSSPNLPDITTVKYYSNGQVAVGWPKRWQNPALQSGVDVALGIAVDAQENVYVTGFSQQPGGNFDIVTLKYNTEGNLLQTAFYNGPVGGFDLGNFILVDDNGMVYVAGFSMGANSGEDGILIKYNNNLQQQWVSRFNGAANGTDRFYGMSVSGSQWIYVTGMTATFNGKTDFVTLKYNALSNVYNWMNTYNGPMNDSDWAFSVFNDPVHGGVVVTGPSMGDGTGMDYATVKYYSDGTIAWTKRAGGYFDDRPNRITTDRWGNVIVTGNSKNANGNFDCLTMKYDPQGNTLWGQNGVRYSGYWDDISNFVATDYNGNVYITGSTMLVGRGSDLLTIKYGFTGNQIWTSTVGDEWNDGGAAIGIDGNQNAYIAGWINPGNDNYITLKYNADITSINMNGEDIPSGYKLNQNFPNPFNPSTQIGFEIPTESNVKLCIYDNLGRVIETLINERMNAGMYNVTWNASNYSSGTYFYKIEASNFTQTRKMLLVK